MRRQSPATDRFVFATDVVLQVIEGEALLLKLHEEKVFSLNQTGAQIAQLISDGCAESQVIDILTREYRIDREHIVCEVEQLIDELKSRGLIVSDRPKGTE